MSSFPLPNHPQYHRESSHQVYQIQAVFLQKVLDTLPVGAFLVGPGDQLLAVNQKLLKMAPLPDSTLDHQDIQGLFDLFCQQAADPDTARQALIDARNQANSHPRILMKLRSPEEKELLWLFFADQTSAGYTPSWGALVIDRTEEQVYSQSAEQFYLQMSAESRKLGAVLQGHLQALLDNLEHWPPGLIKEYLSSAEDQLGQMFLLLDQLMALIQIQQRELHIFPQNQDLVDLIASLQDSYPGDISQQSLRVELPDTFPAVFVDPEQTRRVFLYVLEIAFKHAREGSAITMRGKHTPQFISISIELEQQDLWSAGENPSPERFEPVHQRQFLIGKMIQEMQGGTLSLEQIPEDSQALEIILAFPTSPHASRLDPQKQQIPKAERAERILIADAEADTLTFLKSELEGAGFRVDAVSSGPSVLDMVQVIKPDLLILDRDLPPVDGFQVLAALRRWSAVPVCLISSREDPGELVQALEAGADDYITKPFIIAQLVARVKALLRRYGDSSQEAPLDIFQAKGLRINFNTRQVWRGGNLLDLTPIEYNILAFLARHPQQVLSYEQIINRAWQGPDKGSRQGLFVHVSRLREKVEADPEDPELIRNHWGVGYLFQPDS